jgi:U3 small nucleolar RNA-associated protein 10
VLLTRTIRLADEPFLAILSALITPDTGANPSQRVLTLLVILNDCTGWTRGLGDEAPRNLAKVEQIGEILTASMEKYGFEGAIAAIITAMSER